MTATRRSVLFVAGILLIQPAWAMVPVIDAGEIAQAVQQVKWLHDQYEEMTQQLRAMTNSLNVPNVSPGLLLPGMQNPMGGMTGQLPSLVGGGTSIPGASQFLQQDRVYQPQGKDFAATQMNQSSTSLANLKAIAMQMINTNGTRLGQMNGLMNQLTNAEDVSQVARINGRIAIENQTLAAQQAQFQHLQQLAALQQQVEEQQIRQKIRADDDQQIARTKDNGVGSNTTTDPSFVASSTFVGN